MAGIMGPDVRDWAGGIDVVSGMTSTIVGPMNMLRYQNRSIMVYNNSDTDTLSGCVIQVNNDRGGDEALLQADPWKVNGAPNPNMWMDYDTVSLRSIGPMTAKAVALSGTFRWWRVIGVNELTQTVSASGIVYGTSVN